MTLHAPIAASPVRRELEQPVRLAGLATALPPHLLPQSLAKEIAERVLGPRYAAFERLAASFDTAGVERRYSLAPPDWFERPQDWRSRNDLYLDGATALFVRAARAALAEAGIEAAAVDAVVTVSSTGIATPTLEARAWSAMGFRRDVRRVPVFGLGCAGGVTGLALARDLAAARPGTTVLMVCIEACTLSFRADRLQKADIIATILFGDGAAAAVLRSGEDGGIALGRGHETLWPDTLDIMGWDVDGAGLGVVFDRSIPAFAEAHFAEAVAGAMAATGLPRPCRLVCHPGGAKVLAAIEAAMALAPGSLDAERDVLREHGNMSAPTALFVLQRVLAGGASGSMLLCALGPGFTASFLPLEVGDA